MDKTIYRLFSLLRHSLLGIQSDNSLFCSMTASEWNNLMNISQKQGVTAFALTALNDFVTKPEQALLMKWISYLIKCQLINLRRVKLINSYRG